MSSTAVRRLGLALLLAAIVVVPATETPSAAFALLLVGAVVLSAGAVPHLPPRCAATVCSHYVDRPTPRSSSSGSTRSASPHPGGPPDRVRPASSAAP